MSVNSEQRKLSELEGVVLGIVNKCQPCTAYAVRVQLKQTPSSHWRASAGSIYPLLARFVSEGLLSSSRDKSDGRGRDFLKVTSQGRQALKRWIKAGVDQTLISSVFDPIRSRVFFLNTLSPSERILFAEQIIEAMQQYVAEAQNHLSDRSENKDPFDYLGSLGACMSAESRLKWLIYVQEQLTDSS